MPKRAAAALIASKAPGKISQMSRPSRVTAATGWRRRTLRLVELCMRLDAEHVLCKAMRRWPVAALLEATEGWSAAMFALVARDWRLKKVARLLEAKGRAFTVECCAEWEPEFLQVLLPEVDLVTARHVLAELYFKSDDKHLSPWECRNIVEQYGPKAQRKLLRKFSDRDVERVLRSSPADCSSDEDSEEDEDEENSLEDFIDDGEEGDEGECEEADGEEIVEGASSDDDDDDPMACGASAQGDDACESSSSDDDDGDDDGDEESSSDDDE